MQCSCIIFSNNSFSHGVCVYGKLTVSFRWQYVHTYRTRITTRPQRTTCCNHNVLCVLWTKNCETNAALHNQALVATLKKNVQVLRRPFTFERKKWVWHTYDFVAQSVRNGEPPSRSQLNTQLTYGARRFNRGGEGKFRGFARTRRSSQGSYSFDSEFF